MAVICSCNSNLPLITVRLLSDTVNMMLRVSATIRRKKERNFDEKREKS